MVINELKVTIELGTEMFNHLALAGGTSGDDKEQTDENK